MLYFYLYAPILRVWLGMLALLPARSAADMDFRWDQAEAIVAATDDPHEQDVLTRIDAKESGFRQNVARCEKKGDHGRSFGSYQVQPMSAYDAPLACGTPRQQAALALRYVRRSAEMCPKNVGAMKLALYVSGRCDRGEKEARERWGEED